ncbi:hypothetical protein BUALT_Bualt19G0083800 [Buddleja alternifolia]|uniref:ZF-HD dimerization-type domain-containing protein n=1 Tax=Buddleja alternifolia TaxID=168488 RepID=A0AAV6WAP9_9LAMI|nr:hypothetical protein BUALT_Bualt19G0083800 [Buddleja alternifolia]
MVIIKYKECLKNHAASMGGNATDGCGEFMPSGEDNTLEALICSACNCHRNFHRKEVEGQVQVQQPSSFNNNNNCYYNVNPNISRKIFVGHPQNYHSGRLVMSYNNNNNNSNMGCYDNSDDEEGGGGGGGWGVGRPSQVVKKRFRTKFSTEQKEKMLKFAEKVGWKMQKQEEGMVQQFCQEVGVKRRVLKPRKWLVVELSDSWSVQELGDSSLPEWFYILSLRMLRYDFSVDI